MTKVAQRLYIGCAFAGFVAGALVTRYAPECREGFCWGQSPFLLMFIAGGLTGLAAGSRAPALMMPPVFAGALAGALIGLCVSFGGGLYAFLGGPTGVTRTAPPTPMALVPNPLIGVLGGILGLAGAAVLMFTRLGLGRLRRSTGG